MSIRFIVLRMPGFSESCQDFRHHRSASGSTLRINQEMMVIALPDNPFEAFRRDDVHFQPHRLHIQWIDSNCNSVFQLLSVIPFTNT